MTINFSEMFKAPKTKAVKNKSSVQGNCGLVYQNDTTILDGVFTAVLNALAQGLAIFELGLQGLVGYSIGSNGLSVRAFHQNVQHVIEEPNAKQWTDAIARELTTDTKALISLLADEPMQIFDGSAYCRTIVLARLAELKKTYPALDKHLSFIMDDIEDGLSEAEFKNIQAELIKHKAAKAAKTKKK